MTTQTRKQKRVLLVDDDLDHREVVQDALTSDPDSDNIVDVAASAEVALLMLERAQYDALITDVEMPGIGGLELARRVAGSSNRPRIVVMSGNPFGAAAKAAGADTFLAKPFEPAMLFAALAGVAPA